MVDILLIEPDRLLTRTYTELLTSSGYCVQQVNGAQAGIVAADEGKPKLIVLELQLIEHSGVEFLYELRSYSDWQTIPVIVHSHVPPTEFADSWQLLRDQLSVGEYLYKPQTSLNQLLRSVQRFIPVATSA